MGTGQPEGSGRLSSMDPTSSQDSQTLCAAACANECPSACFNWKHVCADWDLIQQQTEGHPEARRQLVDLAIQQEKCRAAWQAKHSWRIGLLIVVSSVLLIAAGVWGVGHPGMAIRCPALIYAWAGAIGGSTMALYGYTHHLAYGDLEPSFTWWSATKPIFGAVTGSVAAGLIIVGVTSISAKPSSLLLPTLVAFAAGYKERWFLRWLDGMRPAPDGGSSKGKTSPASKKSPQAKSGP